MSFQPRHENKTCRACPKDQHYAFDIWHMSHDIMTSWHDSMTNNHKVTFEHRHENKSCSACPSDQHKHLTYDSMTAWHDSMIAWHDSMTNNHKQWLLSIDMKTKVVQHVPVINISTWDMTAWLDISTFQQHFLVPSCCSTFWKLFVLTILIIRSDCVNLVTKLLLLCTCYYQSLCISPTVNSFSAGRFHQN